MKKWLFLVMTCALLAPAAHARDGWPGGGGFVLTQAGKKGPGQGFQRGDADKRGGQDDRRNQGRLTEQERRELHRDLDRANREIYRR